MFFNLQVFSLVKSKNSVVCPSKFSSAASFFTSLWCTKLYCAHYWAPKLENTHWCLKVGENSSKGEIYGLKKVFPNCVFNFT